MSDNSRVGKIGWIDMTVDDAGGIRDFYKSRCGLGQRGRLHGRLRGLFDDERPAAARP